MRKEAFLYERRDDGAVRCKLCAHRCQIPSGRIGLCRVRKNTDGTLYTHVYGRAAAANVDPIEKKPLYHFLPGTRSYSIGTVGCNFRCGFCQNWRLSQIGVEEGERVRGFDLSPEQVVEEALAADCASIAYTYTEPTIFLEYAYDTARLAHSRGLRNVFVTNGYMTPEATDLIAPYLDACNVDLKSFSDQFYRELCAARLKPVLDSIRRLHERNVWLEATTLVIPGKNDSDDELRAIASFVAEVSPSIVWHVDAFFPTYRLTEVETTPKQTLERARRIGLQAGLRFIYLGNVAGRRDTLCPDCGAAAVRRSFLGSELLATEDGRCPSCGRTIPGVWSAAVTKAR